jgi:hypothetical protein
LVPAQADDSAEAFSHFVSRLPTPTAIGPTDRVPLIQGGVPKSWAPYNAFLNRDGSNLGVAASLFRSNIGLGSSATHAVGDFLQPSSNLSDILSLSTAQANMQTGYTFGAFGAVGDGVTNDTVAMQAAVTAAAGGTAYGVPGATYNLTASVYVPSNTAIDCRGAIIQYDPSISIGNALYWVGSTGTPVGTELASSGVEIKNCQFRSGTSGAAAAINFQPGSKRVRIHNNDFTSTNAYAMTAAVLQVAHLEDISIDHNTGKDIRDFVRVPGDETQTFHHLDIIPNDQGATPYTVSATIKADIDASEAWGVIISAATSTTGLKVGMTISGTDIASNTYITAVAANSDGAKMFLSYGTGTVPTNGQACSTGGGTTVTGTSQNAQITSATASAINQIMTRIIATVVPGTTYWTDLCLLAVTGGTATLQAGEIFIVEQNRY